MEILSQDAAQLTLALYLALMMVGFTRWAIGVASRSWALAVMEKAKRQAKKEGKP